jgi:Ca2+-binding RTX toxin-like protein
MGRRHDRRAGRAVATSTLLAWPLGGFAVPAWAATPTCYGVPATIVATNPHGEVITGTDGNDVIVGGPGPDTIYGRGGDDLICGMGGDDHLYGGPGNDALDGRPGSDVCDGGGGCNTATNCETVIRAVRSQ